MAPTEQTAKETAKAASGTGRGHGKVILLGEHSVVYGRPALAAGLSIGVIARATSAPFAELVVPAWGVALAAGEASDDAATGRHEALYAAFTALLDSYPSRPALRVEAEIELPTGAGLGGSAALSVAIVRAIDSALGIAREDAEVADIALRAERVFHGNPSGIDNAMAAAGGLSLYRRGEGVTPLRAARALPLVIGHSGQPGSTKETVASVARQHANHPAKLEEIFDAIASIVDNGRSALERGELSRFGQLMELNQKLLNTMMLSTTRLEEMCQAAKRAGALGAKLTGGGGGGCMIALCEDRDRAERVREALEALGRETFYAEAGA